MWGGVSKSGSPRSRWKIRSPDCSRARAAAITLPSSEVIRRTGRSATRRAIGILLEVGVAPLYHAITGVVIRGRVSPWGGTGLACSRPHKDVRDPRGPPHHVEVRPPRHLAA